MGVIRRRLERWADMPLYWIAAVLTWLQTGWKTPERALRWQELYPLVVLAAFVVLVVKLTPVMSQQANSLITSIGNSLNNLFQFTISG